MRSLISSSRRCNYNACRNRFHSVSVYFQSNYCRLWKPSIINRSFCSVNNSTNWRNNNTPKRSNRCQVSKRYVSFRDFIPAPENRTIPNMISITRIVCSPGLAVAIYYDMKEVALAGCALAAFTDWLDGYIAKRYNMKSELGAFLDPLGDKFVIGALSVGLAMKELIPMPLVSVIVGRDLFLIGCNFLIRYLEMPAGAKFFDLQSLTYKVTPTTLSRVNTAVQFGLLIVTLNNFAFGVPTIESLEPLHWLTAATTIGSGLGYLTGAGVTPKSGFQDFVRRIMEKYRK